MRSNQQKALAEKPSPQAVLEASCDVCFVPFEKLPVKKLEEGLEILLCSRCHIHVHKCCYDMEANLNVLSDRISEFLCDRCRCDAPRSAGCIVCCGTTGAMKVINERELIHVYCGLVHNDIEVTSYFPALAFKKSLHYEESPQVCEICKNRNAHDQCAEDSCKRKVHTYCAKTTYIELSKEVEEPHSWNHHISIGNHGNFDLTDEVIPIELLSEELEMKLKPIQEMGLDLSFKDAIKAKIHKKYLQELRSRRKTTKKLRRGGFSFVLCPQHESTGYCSCVGKSQGDMVQCECCFQWYHQKCIKFTESEDSFLCSYCRSFYEFKRKAVDQMRGGRSDYEVCKLEQHPLKISVGDCMWALRVIDNRIKGGLGGKMVKQLVKYPLKSSCMDLLIRLQNRGKLTALTEECLNELVGSEQLVGVLRPRAVLAADGQGKARVVEESIDYNKRVRRAVDWLVGLGVGAGWGGVLRELEFKERALTDSYDQIIELSKVEQNYQEVQILKQKAQAYNFIEIINKINSNTDITHLELQQSIAKAQSVPNLPQYLTQTLLGKYQQVAPIISSITSAIQQQPQNTYLISQFIEQLASIHVEPPLEYVQLKMEKKFIQDLHLYFIKQEGMMLEEESTIDQKISDLMACPMLKPSQELTDIVNSYRPASPNPVWRNVDRIAQKCQTVAIEFEIKEILKRRACKQQKFINLMRRANDFLNVGISEEIQNIIRGWSCIRTKYQQATGRSLEEVCEWEELSESLQVVMEVLNLLENYPIKIEEDGKNGGLMLQQLRTRKEELEQLKILYTEAGLQKNPLTITKLLPSLPKNNPLVKQHSNLRREQANFNNKFTTILARISERIENFKNETKKQTRKEQIKENSEKPTLSEINDFIEHLRHSSIDMSREIKELTRIINSSLEIARRVKSYCEEKGDSQHATLEELAVRRKEMDELRRRVLNVAELNLKSELTELYHMEICNRMRTALLSPNLELEKINTLLKFAEEEGLTHVQTYISLKDRYETKSQKSKEVNMVKHLEQMLASEASKDTTPIYSNLYLYRRSLVLPDISEIKIQNNAYIENLIKNNKEYKEKIVNILAQKPRKHDYIEARNVYLDAMKNPFQMPELQRISQQFSKTSEIIRRWKELGKSYNHHNPIFLDYENGIFVVEEIEAVKRELKLNKEELLKLATFIETFEEVYRDQLEEILERIQTNNVIKDTEVCYEAQLKYLQYWMKLLTYNRTKKEVTPVEKLKRLLLDSYNLLQRQLKRGEDYDQLKLIINELEEYVYSAKTHVRTNLPPTATNFLAEGFIDLEELYLEYDDQNDIIESIPLLRPFSDLSKFRVRNLQRIEVRREEVTLKRPREKLQEIKGDSQKNIVIRMQEESSQQAIPQVVSDNQRKKIKQILFKNIRKNAQLRKYGDCEQEVKMIENQIFGQWHNEFIKYFQISEQFEKLFIKLITCPNITNKIIKKKFEFKFIQLLVTNFHKIDEIQNMLASKAKAEENEKTISKMAETVEAKPATSEQAVIDSIASGKMDDSMRQDLKKEMKMIKQSKNKKKKHHHKNRSRSKSRSPDAKFSSDSEKELPRYIQDEYNKEDTPKTDRRQESMSHPQTESPLRYDPEEEEIKSKENVIPKGSLLKLRNCDVEIVSKKKGRVQFGVEMMTDEDHKRIINELLDPGFSRLSIRKEKGQDEIIQYINKSKKKYKYLIGWFEAIKPEDNEYLRELSAEASEKKKIFGWQNQHVKIHIMSIRQLVCIPRFATPTRVSSLQASQVLATDRMIFIFQYPEKLYEIKDIYKPFSEIQRKVEEYPVSVPIPVVEAPVAEMDHYMKYNVPSILPPASKPIFEEPKMAVEYQGWGSQSNSAPIIPPQGISVYSMMPPPVLPPQPLPQPVQQQPIQQTPLIPYKINQIRLQLGFGSFSPIMTDQQDNDDAKNPKEDLASNLLNSLDIRKIPAPAPIAPPLSSRQSRQKPIPQQQQQQQYQSYYNNYNYTLHTRPAQPVTESRWMGYPQGNPQEIPQSAVYNPLNPMIPGKYPAGPQMPVVPPQNPAQIYKPPMGGQRGQPMGGGQYYRGSEGYDPRYQGGYPQ